MDTGTAGHMSGCAGVKEPLVGAWWVRGDAGVVESGIQGGVVPSRAPELGCIQWRGGLMLGHHCLLGQRTRTEETGVRSTEASARPGPARSRDYSWPSTELGRWGAPAPLPPGEELLPRPRPRRLFAGLNPPRFPEVSLAGEAPASDVEPPAVEEPPATVFPPDPVDPPWLASSAWPASDFSSC
jgi:hypothetical protein